MFELLTIPTVLLASALFSKKFKMSDKKKISRFFEIANICVKHKDNRPEYPRFIKQEVSENSTVYLYKLPIGIPSQLIKKLDEVISEGINKPVKVTYESPWLRIQAFEQDIPKNWEWNETNLKPHSWSVLIGKTLDESMYHDFDKVPHLTIAGMTRYGKTVLIKNLVTNLSLQQPKNVHFFIIDLKAGLEFGRYRNLQQVEQVAENPAEALEMLFYIHEMMLKQVEVMKQSYLTNIVDTAIKDRFFVIVDEGANLAPSQGMPRKQKDMLYMCQNLLSEIARVGGALGFRLLFCTQYPTSDTLPRQIKQNADAKIGFRLPTAVASQVAIDENGLEELPSIPGRALFKTDRIYELQVPYLSDKSMWDLLQQYEVIKRVETKASKVKAESKTHRDFIEFE
ncbi:FtsK/SpoIIIE domain-containing protein [Bacillus pseudomycoides]|uniref:FtsK/SpoIIIE domain-containing protein n=1 Tax=Bacillus pseudomycoides TaxID=64104 RepID=UPI003CF90E4E